MSVELPAEPPVDFEMGPDKVQASLMLIEQLGEDAVPAWVRDVAEGIDPKAPASSAPPAGEGDSGRPEDPSDMGGQEIVADTVSAVGLSVSPAQLARALKDDTTPGGNPYALDITVALLTNEQLDFAAARLEDEMRRRQRRHGSPERPPVRTFPESVPEGVMRVEDGGETYELFQGALNLDRRQERGLAHLVTASTEDGHFRDLLTRFVRGPSDGALEQLRRAFAGSVEEWGDCDLFLRQARTDRTLLIVMEWLITGDRRLAVNLPLGWEPGPVVDVREAFAAHRERERGV